jgi:hypothetical protein
MADEIKIEEVKVPSWAEKTASGLKGFFKGMDTIGAALMSSPLINGVWHGFLGGVMLLVISCVKISETGIQLVQVPTLHAVWMAGLGGVFGLAIGIWRSRGGNTPPKVEP